MESLKSQFPRAISYPDRRFLRENDPLQSDSRISRGGDFQRCFNATVPGGCSDKPQPQERAWLDPAAVLRIEP